METKKVFEQIQIKQKRAKNKFEGTIENKKNMLFEEREKSDSLFENKIKSLTDKFRIKQQKEFENMKNGLYRTYPSEPNLRELILKYEREIQKAIKNKE